MRTSRATPSSKTGAAADPPRATESDELSLRAVRVQVDADGIGVSLADGRTVRVPLSWFPRLATATPEERGRWELIGRGTGIHWPLLDEDVSVYSLVHPEATVAARPIDESATRGRGRRAAS